MNGATQDLIVQRIDTFWRHLAEMDEADKKLIEQVSGSPDWTPEQVQQLRESQAEKRAWRVAAFNTSQLKHEERAGLWLDGVGMERVKL